MLGAAEGLLHLPRLQQVPQRCASFVGAVCVLIGAPATAVWAEEVGAGEIPGAVGCVVKSNPSATIVSCPPREMNKGRLYPCRGNENCVSSSSIKSPAQFSPPWNYGPETTDVSIAFNSLLQVLRDDPDAKLASIDVERRYIRATFPAAVPSGAVDDVEFLLLPGDENLCLFRSATRTSVFVYPLQQPLSDRNTNRARMETIRQQLGWATLY